MNRSTVEALLRGAAAGAAASVPQAVVGKLEEILILPRGEDSNIAPRLMNRLGQMLGDDPSVRQNWLLGTLFHVGYGAGWGAVYAAAAERLRLPPLVGGALLGALIYGITFPRWGAAVLTGTERAPDHHSVQMSVVDWSVAMCYGMATGLIYATIARR